MPHATTDLLLMMGLIALATGLALLLEPTRPGREVRSGRCEAG